MRIAPKNRDVLARVADRDFGGATLDDTVQRLLVEHECHAAIARMTPDKREDYRAKNRALGDAALDLPA